MPRSWRCWLRRHATCPHTWAVWEPYPRATSRYVSFTCRCPCHDEEL